MLLNSLSQLLNTFVVDGLSHEYLGLPRPRTGSTHAQHRLQFAFDFIDTLFVSFVNDKNICYLQDASLQRLHPVARAGNQHDYAGVGEIHYVNLSLPYTHSLHQYDIPTHSIHYMENASRGFGQPSMPTPSSQASDKDTLIC